MYKIKIHQKVEVGIINLGKGMDIKVRRVFIRKRKRNIKRLENIVLKRKGQLLHHSHQVVTKVLYQALTLKFV